MGLILLGLGLEMTRFFLRALVAYVNVCAEKLVLTLAIYYTIEVIDAIDNIFLLFFEGRLIFGERVCFYLFFVERGFL